MAGAVITGMTIVSHVISQTKTDAPGLLGTYFADGPLAASVGRDKTRLIPILDRLQADGLIDRQADANDRRNKVVTLTDAGRALLASCRSAVREMERDLMAPVALSDGSALIRALAQMVEATRRTP